jgi:threonine synthase
MGGKNYLGLKCTVCNKRYSELLVGVCPSCGGILTAMYDLGGLTISLQRGRSMWQFSDVLPPVSSEYLVSLDEGWTPYVKANTYGQLIGLRDLWMKLEGQNPTGSFKDRAASVLVSLAKEWGKRGVFTASSGNAAAAISGYSARGGLKCLILVREDSPVSKLGQISMYNPYIVRVRNLFSNRRTLTEFLSTIEGALPGWQNGFLWAPFNPLALEGIKTISYEIASTNTPDYVFVPTAGGDLLYAVYKGFKDLRDLGIINSFPKIVAVQGANANPLVHALDNNLDHVVDVEHAETIAGALKVNFGADHALNAVKQSGGFGVGVTDAEILEAQRDIAKTEGVFTETSSAAALAAVKKSLSQGWVKPNSTVAVILTGTGFKDYTPSFNSVEQIPLIQSSRELGQLVGEAFRL